MTHPIRTLFIATPLLAALAIFASGPDAAAGTNSWEQPTNSWSQPTTNTWSQPKPVEWFQYVVKFTCGTNSGDPVRVVPGVFATAVSLYNWNAADATIHKSIALSYPPEAEASGEVSDSIEDAVSAGTALQVDCGEIRNEFVFQNPPPATDLVQGFLVIESNLSLHVEAVYTGAGTAGDVSVDVEPVAERKAFPRPFVRPTKVVICHYPPGNPDNRHTIVIDKAALPAHQAHGDTLGPCNTD
jgi:hypothetical protein